MKVFPRSAAVALALLAGCPGTNHSNDDAGSPPSSGGAPTDLKITTSRDFAILQVFWKPPVDPFDSYELSALAAGATTAAVVESVRKTETGSGLVFSPAPPEGSTWEIRLRAVRQAQEPDTASATFRFGLIPLLVQQHESLEGEDLWWYQNSQLANTVVIERAPRANEQDTNPSGPWTVMASLPASTTEWIDTSAHEATWYWYRFQSTGAGLESPKFLEAPIPVPVLPPTDFIAIPHPDGGTLTWTNHSTAATALWLQRDLGTIAMLAPMVNTYEDVTGPGCHLYKLGGGAPTVPSSSLSWTATIPLVTSPIGGDFDVIRTLQRLPSAIAFASDGHGGWAMLQVSDPSNSLSDRIVISTQDAGWSPSPPIPGSSGANDLLTDSSGVPHVFFLKDTGAGQDLIHAFYDGSSWTTETVAHRTFLNEGLIPRVAADAVGGLHLLWSSSGHLDTLEYAHRSAGGWDIQSLAPFLPAPISLDPILVDAALAVEPSGTAHAVYFSTPTVLDRVPDGGWNATPVTASLGQVLYPGPNLRLVALSGGDLLLVHRAPTSSPDPGETKAIRRIGRTWGEDRLLVSYDPVQPPFMFATALGDGAAVSIGTQLFLTDAGSFAQTNLGGCSGGAAFGSSADGGMALLHWVLPTDWGLSGLAEAWYTTTTLK